MPQLIKAKNGRDTSGISGLAEMMNLGQSGPFVLRYFCTQSEIEHW
jgi:hypothetical protein